MIEKHSSPHEAATKFIELEAVVCPKCRADEYLINTCDKCNAIGEIIGVKEGK